LASLRPRFAVEWNRFEIGEAGEAMRRGVWGLVAATLVGGPMALRRPVAATTGRCANKRALKQKRAKVEIMNVDDRTEVR
jgi:hypothetical protein